MIRTHFFQITQEFTFPQTPPFWAETLPRWYQLDPYAFLLCELFSLHRLEFNHLVLASPEASNYTDRQFVETGASRAQKFVHTLPNIRASMALEAIGQVAGFTCLQNSPFNLSTGLDEFYKLALEGQKVAFCSSHLAHDESLQNSYQSLLICLAPEGEWVIEKKLQNDPFLQDSSFIKETSQDKHLYKLGPFQLEKLS